MVNKIKIEGFSVVEGLFSPITFSQDQALLYFCWGTFARSRRSFSRFRLWHFRLAPLDFSYEPFHFRRELLTQSKIKLNPSFKSTSLKKLKIKIKALRPKNIKTPHTTFTITPHPHPHPLPFYSLTTL